MIICWLTIVTIYIFFLQFNFLKLKKQIKYLLPFVQDKTLKILTSYIKNENDDLIFENGELLEKKKIKQLNFKDNKYYNKNFIPLPEDCKCNSLEEALENKIVHKIAKYRHSIIREKYNTNSDEVCLFWKPGTIFAQHGTDGTQLLIIIPNSNPLCLYSFINVQRNGFTTTEEFENFKCKNVELLAFPEEYLKTTV